MLIKIVNIVVSILYLSFVILVARSDKKKREIDKRVLVYGVIVTVVSVIAQYFITKEKLNRIIIYLIVIVLLELLSIQITKKKKKKYDYQINLLIVLVLFNMFSNELATITTIGLTLIISGIYIEISKIFKGKVKSKGKLKKNAKVPIAFFMSISNIIALVSVYIYSIVCNL